MARDFYESVIGKPNTTDGDFTVLGGVRISVFQRGTTNLVTIYQREVGVTQGPSPECGATGGPNPFLTGQGHDLDLGHPTGSVQFWADAPGRYDILVEDTIVPARIGSRTIPWNAKAVDDIPETSLAQAVLDMVVPIGGQMPYTGDGDPPGGRFLLSDGRFVLIADYPVYASRTGHKYNNWVDPGGGLIKIPDKRGRASRGADNMGTAQGAAGRLSSLPIGQRASGQGIGSDTHSHTANIPSHTHSGNIPSHTHSGSVPNHYHNADGGLTTGSHSHGGITASGWGAVVNVQSLGGGPLILTRGYGAGGDHQHGISADGNLGVYGNVGYVVGSLAYTTGGPSATAFVTGAPSVTAFTTDPGSTLDPSEVDNWIVRMK